MVEIVYSYKKVGECKGCVFESYNRKSQPCILCERNEILFREIKDRFQKNKESLFSSSNSNTPGNNTEQCKRSVEIKNPVQERNIEYLKAWGLNEDGARIIKETKRKREGLL